MIGSKDLDFSYSGLKTSALYRIQSMEKVSPEDKEELARAFEDAAIGILIRKTRQAIESYPTKTLVVGGGVSANIYLRESLRALISEYPEVKLLLPERSMSTDNAVMIGITSYINYLKNPNILETVEPIRASGHLRLA
jgi:N6-L-threonylcarbamoyladenine synthase